MENGRGFAVNENSIDRANISTRIMSGKLKSKLGVYRSSPMPLLSLPTPFPDGRNLWQPRQPFRNPFFRISTRMMSGKLKSKLGVYRSSPIPLLSLATSGTLGNFFRNLFFANPYTYRYSMIILVEWATVGHHCWSISVSPRPAERAPNQHVLGRLGSFSYPGVPYVTAVGSSLVFHPSPTSAWARETELPAGEPHGRIPLQLGTSSLL